MISVSGIGPGNIKYLTVEVRDRILEADRVVAFGRVKNTLSTLREDILEITSLKDLIPLIDGDVAILASGDSMFYGITDYLLRNSIEIDVVQPGITSFQYLVNKLRIAWQGANLLSLHGREENLKSVEFSKTSIILTDKINTPSLISRKLMEMGIKGKMIAGYNLSYPDELIEKKEIGQDFSDITSLAVVIVENEMV